MVVKMCSFAAVSTRRQFLLWSPLCANTLLLSAFSGKRKTRFLELHDKVFFLFSLTSFIVLTFVSNYPAATRCKSASQTGRISSWRKKSFQCKDTNCTWLEKQNFCDWYLCFCCQRHCVWVHNIDRISQNNRSEESLKITGKKRFSIFVVDENCGKSFVKVLRHWNTENLRL